MGELFSYLTTFTVLQMTENPCWQPANIVDAVIYQDTVFCLLVFWILL